MKKIVNKDLESLQKTADAYHELYWQTLEEIKKLKIKSIDLNLEGKFIKYTELGCTSYLYVQEVFKDNMRFDRFDYSYCLRGLGFDGAFTGYWDDTTFSWGYDYEIYVYGNGDEFFKKVESIEEITPEEFKEKFKEYVEKLTEYQDKYINKKTENNE